ncbi:MAG TPA: hypothetical protein VH458_11770 [Vicinamibacterales bacterium]|jgi:hypothetical protein
MSWLLRVTIIFVGGALALATIASAASDPGQNVQATGTVLLALYRSSPTLVQRLFVDDIDNEFFPLEPGTTFIYEGTKDGVPTRNETEVTHRTFRLLNVECAVVRDRAFESNVLVEDTFDYYAQDRSGNVWYFGEDTKELDAKGNVISTEGSWRAGVNGAAPGLIMEAHPKPGDLYYQELAAGVAEDQASVRSLNGSSCTPFDCFDHLLRTRETSRFEPGVLEQKYYAKHVGFVRSDIISGGNEHSALVRIQHH